MAVSWLRSYLTDYFDFVNVNGDKSIKVYMYTKVKFGVPQGSALGPLLSSPIYARSGNNYS